jgi:hypothetical protein
VRRIALLEPRPGRAYLPDNDQFIVAEVFVAKQGDEFVVSTNNDHIPHLRISNTYKDLMAQADSSAEVREYIREKIRAGKFLIKSIQQRRAGRGGRQSHGAPAHRAAVGVHRPVSPRTHLVGLPGRWQTNGTA